MATIMKSEPTPPDREVLTGLVERVTYQNAENGFCVLRVKARGSPWSAMPPRSRPANGSQPPATGSTTGAFSHQSADLVGHRLHASLDVGRICEVVGGGRFRSRELAREPDVGGGGRRPPPRSWAVSRGWEGISPLSPLGSALLN